MRRWAWPSTWEAARWPCTPPMRSLRSTSSQPPPKPSDPARSGPKHTRSITWSALWGSISAIGWRVFIDAIEMQPLTKYAIRHACSGAFHCFWTDAPAPEIGRCWTARNTFGSRAPDAPDERHGQRIAKAASRQGSTMAPFRPNMSTHAHIARTLRFTSIH